MLSASAWSLEQDKDVSSYHLYLTFVLEKQWNKLKKKTHWLEKKKENSEVVAFIEKSK
jgi:hypothetical protein